LYLYVDHWDRHERFSVSANKTYDRLSGSGNVVTVNGMLYTETHLRSLVFKASKEQVSEILLFEKEETPFKGVDLARKAWALIDLNCMRVYAIKLFIVSVGETSVAAHLGYLELDLYGRTDTIQPNLPATEEFTINELREMMDIVSEPPTFPQDDDFDDVATPSSAITVRGSGSGSGSDSGAPSNVLIVNMANSVNSIANSFEKLNSVARNLERIADCTEKITKLLSK